MKQFLTQFDAELKQWFDAKRKDYQASQAADPLFFELFDAVVDLALAGGKRVRPYMAYLMYQSATGEEPTDFQPLIALELFHVFGLIHDDIIDGGDSRRGVPTLHRKMIDERYAGNIHIGQSQAMLMGDLVFSWCHELFDTSNYSREIRHAIKELFAKMSEAVMIGQMIDVDLTTQDGATMERIEQKMKLKTASYTFVYPMQIGLALAGNTDAKQMQFCDEFGTALGLAFQIQDDLLDVLGDEAVTGKTPLRDIAEGQHTYITQHVFEQGSTADIELLETYFRNELPETAIKPLRTMLEDSGAIAFAKQQAAVAFVQAKDILSSIDMDESTATALASLIQYIESRNA